MAAIAVPELRIVQEEKYKIIVITVALDHQQDMKTFISVLLITIARIDENLTEENHAGPERPAGVGLSGLQAALLT